MELRLLTDNFESKLEIARRLLRETDPAEVWRQASGKQHNVVLLYGYIRSFVRLAQLRDISLVADELETTRQTVGRHIQELENLLDIRLFQKIGMHSVLSDGGMLWFPRAEELFDLASGFDARHSQTNYRSVLVPLRELLAESKPTITQSFVNTWMRSSKSMTSQSLRKFRKSWVIYERVNGTWISREIGEEAAFAQWFGKDLAQQGVGQTVAEMAGGADLKDELSLLLDGVLTRGGVQLSEASCMLPREIGGVRQPLMYQRVLAELMDDRKVPVIASVIQILDPPRPTQVLGQVAQAS